MWSQIFWILVMVQWKWTVLAETTKSSIEALETINNGKMNPKSLKIFPTVTATEISKNNEYFNDDSIKNTEVTTETTQHSDDNIRNNFTHDGDLFSDSEATKLDQTTDKTFKNFIVNGLHLNDFNDFSSDETFNDIPELTAMSQVHQASAVTEINVYESINGKTIQRKPTEEELKLIQSNKNNQIIEDLDSEFAKDGAGLFESYDDNDEPAGGFRQFFHSEIKNFSNINEVNITINETEGDFFGDDDSATTKYDLIEKLMNKDDSFATTTENINTTISVQNAEIPSTVLSHTEIATELYNPTADELVNLLPGNKGTNIATAADQTTTSSSKISTDVELVESSTETSSDFQNEITEAVKTEMLSEKELNIQSINNQNTEMFFETKTQKDRIDNLSTEAKLVESTTKTATDFQNQVTVGAEILAKSGLNIQTVVNQNTEIFSETTTQPDSSKEARIVESPTQNATNFQQPVTDGAEILVENGPHIQTIDNQSTELFLETITQDDTIDLSTQGNFVGSPTETAADFRNPVTAGAEILTESGLNIQTVVNQNTKILSETTTQPDSSKEARIVESPTQNATDFQQPVTVGAEIPAENGLHIQTIDNQSTELFSETTTQDLSTREKLVGSPTETATDFRNPVTAGAESLTESGLNIQTVVNQNTKILSETTIQIDSLKEATFAESSTQSATDFQNPVTDGSEILPQNELNIHTVVNQNTEMFSETTTQIDSSKEATIFESSTQTATDFQNPVTSGAEILVENGLNIQTVVNQNTEIFSEITTQNDSLYLSTEAESSAGTVTEFQNLLSKTTGTEILDENRDKNIRTAADQSSIGIFSALTTQNDSLNSLTASTNVVLVESSTETASDFQSRITEPIETEILAENGLSVKDFNEITNLLATSLNEIRISEETETITLKENKLESPTIPPNTSTVEINFNDSTLPTTNFRAMQVAEETTTSTFELVPTITVLMKSTADETKTGQLTDELFQAITEFHEENKTEVTTEYKLFVNMDKTTTGSFQDIKTDSIIENISEMITLPEIGTMLSIIEHTPITSSFDEVKTDSVATIVTELTRTESIIGDGVSKVKTEPITTFKKSAESHIQKITESNLEMTSVVAVTEHIKENLTETSTIFLDEDFNNVETSTCRETTTTIPDKNFLLTAVDDFKKVFHELTPSQVESIINTKIEQQESMVDEFWTIFNGNSKKIDHFEEPNFIDTVADDKTVEIEGPDFIDAEIVPHDRKTVKIVPLLRNKILESFAEFSIKISQKEDIFYIPSFAQIKEYADIVNITWKTNEAQNNSLAFRVIEKEDFYVIKDIFMNVFRGNKFNMQQKPVALTPDPDMDNTMTGRTRTVTMKDGTSITFSNVEFLIKPPLKREISEAASNDPKMWHFEVASISLGVIAVIVILIYYIAVKTGTKITIKDELHQVTHC